MELKFNKNGDAWVAEFEATDKFNLHMEGLLLGSFSILQRTAGGKYTHVRDIPTYPRFDKVFDYDFDALVYPKYIKIVSETEPTYAEVVSDGEITEIKSQTKEVEVTANGTTQVAPDAGYSYLTGVTVKTNVPQSGGSGGGAEASSMEYLDVSGIDFAGGGQKEGYLIALCYHMNGSHSTIGDFILPIGQVYVVKTANLTSVRYLAFDFSSKVVMGGQTMSVRETLLTTGWTEAELNAIPRITKEEFYTI